LPIADWGCPNSAIGNWQSAIHFLAQRKAFLLRVDPALLEAIQRWADDDLRSLNGQIEFLLREALAEAGRARPNAASDPKELPPGAPGPGE
jgi:hypothetical protein